MKKKKNVLCMEIDEILPPQRLNRVPIDVDDQNKLANEMVEWVIKTNTYCLANFPLLKSYAPSKFYKIANYNEYFADCLDFARYMIASRLQQSWEDKTVDRDYAKLWLAIYDEQYRDITMQKHRITEELRQGVSTFNIVVPEIGNGK